MVSTVMLVVCVFSLSRIDNVRYSMLHVMVQQSLLTHSCVCELTRTLQIRAEQLRWPLLQVTAMHM